MHLLDRTGAHFVFLDGFGLTRVSAPGKVKTDRSVSGGLDGSLSLTPSEARMHVYVGGFGGKARGLDFPSLSNAKSLARFAGDNTAIHPDGARHLIFGNWVSYEPEARVRVATIDGDKRTIRSDTPYDAQPCPSLAPLTVSDRRPGRYHTRRFALSPDGTFAHHVGRDADVVHVGRIGPGDKAPTMLFRVPLAVSQGDVLRLAPGRGGVTILAYSAAEQVGRVVRVEADGAVQRVERACVSMPSDASAGEALGDVLWQVAPDAVVRTDAKGVERGSYAIRDEATQGPGRLAARGAHVWFVPWDGERVLDLSADRVIDRKLADKERELRAFFSAYVRRRNEIDAAANLVTCLSELSVHANQPRFAWRLECTQGDGSLLAWLCVQQHRLLAEDPRMENLAGYPQSCAAMGVVYLPADRVFSRDETVAALARLRAFDVSALFTMLGVWQLYTDRLGYNLTDDRLSPLDPDAEMYWLAAAVATLLARDPAQAVSVTPGEVCLALDAIDAAQVQTHRGALTLGLAALSTRVFGVAAGEVYAHLLRTTVRVPGAVGYEMRQAIPWQLGAHPGSREVIKAAWRAGPPPGDEGAALWSDLEATFA